MTSFLSYVAGMLVLLALGVAPVSAQGPDSTRRVTSSGVYTAAQAAAGKDFYANKCTGCHNAASHIGEPFTGGWRGKVVSELLAYIRDNMPKDDPGTLTPEQIAPVIAYLLQLNAQPEGASELPSDTSQLRHITIDFPGGLLSQAQRRARLGALFSVGGHRN